MIIKPALLCCYPVYISLGDSANVKLQSIKDRAHKIVGNDNDVSLKWDRLEQIRKKRISIDAFKSINGISSESAQNTFTKLDHCKNTRRNVSLLILPKMGNESGRKTFTFQGAAIYNSLPSDIRNESHFVTLKRKINTFSF